MITAWMMAVQAIAPAHGLPPRSAPPEVSAPTGDWSTLPAIPWRAAPRSDAAVSQFVADEVKAGRCTAEQGARAALLRIDVAVLADRNGQVRAIVPRAIQCPTVEQYASGLVSRWARDNLDTAASAGPTWYRAALTFSWSE